MAAYRASARSWAIAQAGAQRHRGMPTRCERAPKRAPSPSDGRGKAGVPRPKARPREPRPTVREPRKSPKPRLTRKRAGSTACIYMHTRCSRSAPGRDKQLGAAICSDPDVANAMARRRLAPESEQSSSWLRPPDAQASRSWPPLFCEPHDSFALGAVTAASAIAWPGLSDCGSRSRGCRRENRGCFARRGEVKLILPSRRQSHRALPEAGDDDPAVTASRTGCTEHRLLRADQAATASAPILGPQRVHQPPGRFPE